MNVLYVYERPQSDCTVHVRDLRVRLCVVSLTHFGLLVLHLCEDEQEAAYCVPETTVCQCELVANAGALRVTYSILAIESITNSPLNQGSFPVVGQRE